MAEIDFRIPLQARGVQTPSIAPTLLAIGQLQRGQQRGRLNEQLLAKGEAEAERAAQIQKALASLGQPGGQGNVPRAAPRAPEAIDVPFRDLSVPPSSGAPQASPELAGGAIGPQALAPGAQSQAPQAQRREHVVAVARRLTALGASDKAAKIMANHNAEISLRLKEFDLVQVKMQAAGNIAAVITSQESLERNRPRLQAMACDIWPNCRVPSLYSKDEFDELKRLGQTSAEEVAENRLDLEQQKINATGEGGLGQRFQRANVLRDDFEKRAAPFRGLQDNIQVVRAAVENPSAAGDVALVFGFMKLLDPTSVVREGEQLMIRQTGAITDRVFNFATRLLSGRLFGTEEGGNIRRDLAGRAEKVFTNRSKRFKVLEKEFRGAATRANVDPRDVVISTPLPVARSGGLSAADKQGLRDRGASEAEINALDRNRGGR